MIATISRRTDAGPPHRIESQSGLTLLELLIVLVILGLIGSIGTMQLMQHLGKAKVDTARLQIEQVGTALDIFRIDSGRLPSTEEGLAVLLSAPIGLTGWNGPYLKKRSAIDDPWGRPFLYRFPGEQGEYDLISLGSDGRPGGNSENQDLSNR